MVVVTLAQTEHGIPPIMSCSEFHKPQG